MISIIGSGKIGTNVVAHLSFKGIDDLTLVDVIKGLPQGEAADIEQMPSACGMDKKVRGTSQRNPGVFRPSRDSDNKRQPHQRVVGKYSYSKR